MVKVKRENIQAALQMCHDRLVLLTKKLTQITEEYEKELESVKQEMLDISEYADILEALEQER